MSTKNAPAMRSIWNGSVSVGRLAVPVKVFSAITDRRIHFREVHRSDLSPIEHRRFCSLEEKEVVWDEVRRGLELEDGSLVLFEKDELKVVADEARKTIDLEGFVEQSAVSDEFIDRAYFLGAQESGREEYRLLCETMSREQKAAVGMIALRGSRRVVMLEANGSDPLMLYTLRPASSIVAPSSLEPIGEPHRRIQDAEFDAARRLIEEMSGVFVAEDFPDRHREALMELIERKASGIALDMEAKPPLPPADDLTEALESSLALLSTGPVEEPV